MRLICPNCSAQYEIDASLIPDEGRDVQCSNCGHTWFELPPPPTEFAAPPPEAEPQAEPEAVEEPEAAEESEAEAQIPTEAKAEAEDTADVVTRRLEEPDEEEETYSESEESASAATASSAVRALAAATKEAEHAKEEAAEDEEQLAPTQLKRRRPADAAALDILKEEADRELAQRRTEPSAPIETQTDMAFDEIRDRKSPSRALRARMAKSDAETTRVLPEHEVVSERSYQPPRRDLLPDIDEINSSLKPKPDRSAAAAATERRGGFRAGFLLMILLTALLIFAYAWAPAIAARVPALEPALIGYVDWANGVRDWMDGLLSTRQ